MNKFINTLKSIDPMLAVAFTLTFAVAFMLGQATKDASETAQLLADNRDGKLIHTDDPVFFPDSVPVIEPIDCEPGDKECEKANKHAGKPAHYPAICEPYIFPN